jgi:hypothetical protein
MVDQEESVMRVACLWAARLVAFSPSGWAICCMAVGAMQMGDDTFSPRIVVCMSMLDTSTRMRGMRRSLEKASLFSLSVIMSLDPDA